MNMFVIHVQLLLVCSAVGYTQTCFPCACYMGYEYLDCYGNSIEQYPELDIFITTKLKVISLQSTFIRYLPTISNDDYPILQTFTDINNIVLECEDVIRWYYILPSVMFTTKCLLPTYQTWNSLNTPFTDIDDINTGTIITIQKRNTAQTSDSIKNYATTETSWSITITTSTSTTVYATFSAGGITNTVTGTATDSNGDNDVTTENIVGTKVYLWAIYLSAFLIIVLCGLCSIHVYCKLRLKGTVNRIEHFSLDIINNDDEEYEIYSVV